jgi:hypothetical protein
LFEFAKANRSWKDPLDDFKFIKEEFKLFSSVLREGKCCNIIRSTARFSLTGSGGTLVAVFRPFMTIGALLVAYDCAIFMAKQD